MEEKPAAPPPKRAASGLASTAVRPTLGLMNDAVEERLTRLESNVAHLEHLADQLNGVAVEQGREIEQVKRQLQRLSQALDTVELDRIKSTHPKPPHYQ